MSVVPNSNDIAIWLRFQIAAGRFADSSDTTQMSLLARKLGVKLATISAAYEQLGNRCTNRRDHLTKVVRTREYGVIADLVDQIVELDGPDAKTVEDF